MSAPPAQIEIQNLLRFLTQDAKLPLPDALPKVGVLRKQGLHNTNDIVAADPEVLKLVFETDKRVKQILNAAKRVTSPKKRGSSDSPGVATSKRVKSVHQHASFDSEDRFELPASTLPSEDLANTEIETNRAPLVLAFAVTVLKYTMPEQPVSSRLSIAQALVSANSQSKAKSIGLLSGKSAEDEGWADGQPKLKVLGREIAVLKRHKPPPDLDEETDGLHDVQSFDTFWGLDVEALRKSNGPLTAGKSSGSIGPPIHTPEAARSYLLKSMSIASCPSETTPPTPKKKSKPKPTEIMARKEEALSMLLRAIDLLCESWAATLSKPELDARAWSWYIQVRPAVAEGQAGWGQKGKVQLADILSLRRVQ